MFFRGVCLSVFSVAALSVCLVQAETCEILFGNVNVENLHPVPMDRRFPKLAEYTPANHRSQYGIVDPAGTPSRPWVDWNEERLQLKLDQIWRAYEEIGLPSVLGVSEINDGPVLSRLARRLGFPQWLATNSQGHRGMDVGLLVARHPHVEVLQHYSHRLGGPSYAQGGSRDIHIITLRIAGVHKLHMLLNHWPSQGARELGNEMRADAARQLRGLVVELMEKYPGSHVIALGDFNVLEHEQTMEGQHPFRDILTIPHGPYSMMDLFEVPDFVSKDPQPDGDYFYAPEESWNRLLRVFVSRSLLLPESPIRIKRNSFRIHAPELLSEDYRLRDGSTIQTPKRYNPMGRTPDEVGFFDHYPLEWSIEVELPVTRRPREKAFELGKDVLLVDDVALYSTNSGRRKFITWKEFKENESEIRDGTWGSGIWELREDSLGYYEREPNFREDDLYNLQFKRLEVARGNQWKGPEFDQLVEALSDPISARQVKIISALKVPPEWILQSLTYLYGEGYFEHLPRLENIETGLDEGR